MRLCHSLAGLVEPGTGSGQTLIPQGHENQTNGMPGSGQTLITLILPQGHEKTNGMDTLLRRKS